MVASSWYFKVIMTGMSYSHYLICKCMSLFEFYYVICLSHCEREYHVGCLKNHKMVDLKEILKEEWFCSCESGIIYAALQRLVIHGEVQLQLSDLDIIKKHKESDSNASANIRWRLLNSKTFGPETKSLYTAEVSILYFSGKTVSILGLGRIGLAIAKRAEAFGCPISYYSRSEKLNTNYKYYSTVFDFGSQLRCIGSCLRTYRRNPPHRDVINTLGPKGVLVNIGRGPYVDELELTPALLEGRLGGVGLGVFEQEPHVPEKLFGLDNVVVLPHVGSGTMKTRKAMAYLILANLEANVTSKPLLTPVVRL